MSSALWPCEEEAQTYMEKHKIIELLDNLTAQVVFHRPGSTHGTVGVSLARLECPVWRRPKSRRKQAQCGNRK